jgi:hypothetical protein
VMLSASILLKPLFPSFGMATHILMPDHHSTLSASCISGLIRMVITLLRHG